MSGFIGSIETSVARRNVPLKTKYAEIAGMRYEGSKHTKTQPNLMRKKESDQ